MTFQVWLNKLGLITFGVNNVAIHVLPRRPWEWGYTQDWHDGPLHSIGLGPLLLVCWF